MAFDVLLVREGNRLAAANPISAEAIAGIKHGETVTAAIRRTRNGKHHRKFFALLKVVFDAQTRFATQEQLLDAMKMATGYFDVSQTVDGVPFARPKSISWAAMDQTAFEQFYNKAVDVILTKILPNTNRQDLEAQVQDILNGYN